jgi:hypothetical protein
MNREQIINHARNYPTSRAAPLRTPISYPVCDRYRTLYLRISGGNKTFQPAAPAFFVDRMTQVIAARADFLVCGKDAVHGADRAVVDALVEQAGVDLGGQPRRRSAARAEGRVRFGARQPPAHAVISVWDDAHLTAGPDGRADGTLTYTMRQSSTLPYGEERETGASAWSDTAPVPYPTVHVRQPKDQSICSVGHATDRSGQTLHSARAARLRPRVRTQ